ncbi:dynamin family protein [Aquabacterium sp. J223]|uniref:dynamin family protein n=1 Tax=Aquabacterium sp. J223 TaxID=2898431 RepID=UPI0021AD67C0|nr:dynamin family protein [Aquabacterium sp. J223]UUX96585.1 dynamin family protein [Aquabacterium sp. J223]
MPAVLPTFAARLDALADWRAGLQRHLADWGRLLAEHGLLEHGAETGLAALQERLAGDKLVLAFVAEFSRGKSELINAIFFADTGQRVLPATPGRTTMCPVELLHEEGEAPGLSLLPVQTRLQGLSLAELRDRPDAWTRHELDGSPDRLATTLREVTRTLRVPVADAKALGFWDDERPEDNPPQGDDGLVEVPAWRHARIVYPHPLLKRGLVVLDTPGLNAIGAEPELTLGLLPSAHAAIFLLGADTGVTRSDLAVWREHLGSPSLVRYAVLNKVDTLADPLATAEQVREQVAAQRAAAAQALGLDLQRVFPLSARQALAARIAGDELLLHASGVPALEAAIGRQLLPLRRQILAQAVVEGRDRVQSAVLRRLTDQRRQNAEQLLELKGLRGKSAVRTEALLRRVEQEAADFERSTARLTAMRSVHARLLKEALLPLASERLREEVVRLQADLDSGLLRLGARKAFQSLCQRLHALLAQAGVGAQEVGTMLQATFQQLNSEFGFALTLGSTPGLERYRRELDLIARNYGHYLGPTQALRLADARFREQFRRMLLSKLRMVFESASAELELWSKNAAAQVDAQLRERRRGFKRRREALLRIRQAAGELEQRIGELQSEEQHLQRLQARLTALAAAIDEATQAPQGAEDDPAWAAPPVLTLVSAGRAGR